MRPVLIQIHLVDHVAYLLEQALIGHHHLLTKRAAHFEESERSRPALCNSLFGLSVIPQQFNGLKRGRTSEFPRGMPRGIPFQVDDLINWKVEVALLSNEHGTANRVDDVVIPSGIDNLTVTQRVGLGSELVLPSSLSTGIRFRSAQTNHTASTIIPRWEWPIPETRAQLFTGRF